MKMMDMMKVMAFVGGLGVASASAPAGVRPMTVVRDLRRGIKEMHLTKEQKTEIRGVLKSHSGEIRAAAERLWEARRALHEAVRQEPFDEALIRERAAGAAVATGDLAVVGARVRAEVLGLLTDEQRQKADVLQDRLLKDVAGLRQKARALVDERLGTE
jgi:Spy/CpxP family protein refolding chaperone